MIHDAATLQMIEEMLDLIDGDGVARARIHSASFLERAASVDSDEFPVVVEQRATGVSRVDRRIDLNAVGVFKKRSRRILIPVHAAHDSVGHSRSKVSRQQKRIAHRVGPVPDADLVAVAERGGGKVIAAQQFHQGHVAGRVDPDNHSIIENAVIEPALHEVAGPARDVEIAERVTVRADQNSGAASVAAFAKDRDHAGSDLLDNLDASALRFQNAGVRGA